MDDGGLMKEVTAVGKTEFGSGVDECVAQLKCSSLVQRGAFGLFGDSSVYRR